MRYVAMHFALWLGVAVLAYALWIDYYIGNTFNLQSWSLPTRLYAAPLELVDGKRVERSYLESTLKQLGYYPVNGKPSRGEYRFAGDQCWIGSRGYPFAEDKEPARYLRIDFSGGAIRRMTDFVSNEAVAIARLEPIEIGRVHAATFEDREIISLGDLPSEALKLLIAVEDRRFFEHFGVDPVGITRALLSNVRTGKIAQGGSTLTQQLIKNIYLSREKTLTRKAKEALMALSLERHVGKQQILTAYINEIFLGQDGNRAIHGLGLGARFYFGKPAKELSLAEAATLIGMIRAPSAYNPKRHPNDARKRRDTILKLGRERGILTDSQFRDAIEERLVVRSVGPIKTRQFGAFIDAVRSQLHEHYREEDLRQAGLRIYTTLDPAVQTITQAEITAGVTAIERRLNASNSLQAAAVVVDPRTGEVLSIVGGRDSTIGKFNRAVHAERSIGSLVKPFVYLEALTRSEQYNVLTELSDTAVTITDVDGNAWRPKNYDGKTHGAVSLRQAIAQSYNLATVNLGMELGVEAIVSRLREFGLEKTIHPYPSVLLGAVETNPFVAAQLYQVIANNGFRIPLRVISSVTDNNHQSIRRYSPDVQQLIPSSVATALRYLLIGVVEKGTAKRLVHEFPHALPLAGKTGTSDDGRDSWFAGFGGNLMAVVWMGRDDNGPTRLTGSSGALTLWSRVMAQLNIKPLRIGATSGLEWAWITADGHAIADAECGGVEEVPLVLPHGLPISPACRTTTDDAPIWDKFRNLFRR